MHMLDYRPIGHQAKDTGELRSYELTLAPSTWFGNLPQRSL